MRTTDQIRILVVDDSPSARAIIRALLEEEGGIRVVGEAANGLEAVRLTRELTPHLITMDLEMPVMDGMEAIEEIMASHAVPILVVSDKANATSAYEAVSRGALEVVPKPGLDEGVEFADKVRLLAGVPVITHLRRRPTSPSPGAGNPFPHPGTPRPGASHPDQGGRLFAIASSTGGPQALAAILAQLPATFPAPVLIAQHISDGFAAGMAQWLDRLTPLTVRLAREGDPLLPGWVYLSPSERNLAITREQRIHLAERTPREIYRPCCDVLLSSVARACGTRGVGIILTGMGHDGVAGMEAIQRGGGTTLAQDEASSVVFGMNKVAIDGGWVRRVLPLERIPAEMVGLASAAPFTTPHRTGSGAS